MSRLEIHPLTADFLDDAARLLAERHRRHRAAEPLLLPRYEEPPAARAEIEALLTRDEADGVAATRDGDVVGFLIGIRSPDDVWGPNVWVEPAGHAPERADDVRWRVTNLRSSRFWPARGFRTTFLRLHRLIA